MSSRSLRPGEDIPTTEPRRYVNSRGYIILRWRIDGDIVQAPEHRVVMGLPEGVVHHKNGNRSDNRPENLEVLSSSEHGRHHGRWPKLDDAEIAKLYAEGLSTPRVAQRMRCSTGSVHRSLVRSGTPRRTRSEARRMAKP